MGSDLRAEMKALCRKHNAQVVAVLLAEEILVQVREDESAPMGPINELATEMLLLGTPEVDAGNGVGCP